MIRKWSMQNQEKNKIFEDFDRDDMLHYLKKDKDMEKRIKEIVTDVVTDLFRVLWQRKSSYESELKR
jgi:Txe/YoeB family toxin of Txe-Axe toxin-antitoxin module